MMAMKKTIWVLVVLLVVVIGSGILQSLSLRKEGNRLDKLLHLYIPMELAAREIEVSIWKTEGHLAGQGRFSNHAPGRDLRNQGA